MGGPKTSSNRYRNTHWYKQRNWGIILRKKKNNQLREKRSRALCSKHKLFPVIVVVVVLTPKTPNQ